MTKFAFKLGAILKVVFVATVIGIALYHEYGFKKTEFSSLLEKLDFKLNIQLPFYIHILAICLPLAYLFSVLVTNLFAFLPCTRISKYFNRQNPGRIIFILEVVLLGTLLFVAYPKLENAFEKKDYGVLGAYLERFVDPEESSKLHLVTKLEALNFLIPILASLLVLTTFWQIRKMNQAKCAQVFTEN